MDVFLYPVTGPRRELTEQEVIQLNVLSGRFMGQPTLSAAINMVEPHLGTQAVDALAQTAHYAAYGVTDAYDWGMPVNKAATTHMQALLDLPLEEPLYGPILLIEVRPPGQHERPLDLFS